MNWWPLSFNRFYQSFNKDYTNLHTEDHTNHTKKRSKSSANKKKIVFKVRVDEIKDAVERIGAKGSWRLFNYDRQYQFKSDDKCIMNFWESTGRINFQGMKTEWDLEGKLVRYLNNKSKLLN